MSNLIPILRTDKNGRTVIRHVRPDKAGTQGSRSFPSPDASTASQQGHTGMVKHVARDHKARIKAFLSGSDLGAWERRKLMKTLHRDTLAVLAQHGVGGAQKLPADLIEYCARIGKFTPLNDMAAYLEDYSDEMQDHRGSLSSEYGSYELASYLIGLGGGKATNQLLASFGFEPYSQSGPEDRAVQHAVIEAARTINSDFTRVSDREDGFPVKRLASYALVDYIKENPEKTEAVVKLINERGIEPYEKGLKDIEGLMNAREEVGTPLQDGAL